MGMRALVMLPLGARQPGALPLGLRLFIVMLPWGARQPRVLPTSNDLSLLVGSTHVRHSPLHYQAHTLTPHRTRGICNGHSIATAFHAMGRACGAVWIWGSMEACVVRATTHPPSMSSSMASSTRSRFSSTVFFSTCCL
eukprot:363360-Chlamydomonas_euryale.AAC.1